MARPKPAPAVRPALVRRDAAPLPCDQVTPLSRSTSRTDPGGARAGRDRWPAPRRRSRPAVGEREQGAELADRHHPRRRSRPSSRCAAPRVAPPSRLRRPRPDRRTGAAVSRRSRRCWSNRRAPAAPAFANIPGPGRSGSVRRNAADAAQRRIVAAARNVVQVATSEVLRRSDSRNLRLRCSARAAGFAAFCYQLVATRSVPEVLGHVKAVRQLLPNRQTALATGARVSGLGFGIAGHSR